MAHRPDPLEKGERLAVAAEHHVLPVVDHVARLTVREGRRASAQACPCLQHDDPLAGLSERSQSHAAPAAPFGPHGQGQTRFQMGPEFRPMPGAEGWQISNPPILQMAALRATLEIFDEALADYEASTGSNMIHLLEDAAHLPVLADDEGHPARAAVSEGGGRRG